MGVTGLPLVAITDSTQAGRDLHSAANKAAQRTLLGLGTAATKNTGTSAGNVVALDGSARMPAVDGSQLTNLSAGGGTYIHTIHMPTIPANMWLVPKHDGHTTQTTITNHLYACWLDFEYPMTISELALNVTVAAPGGSTVDLAIAEDWTDGSGESRPGAYIAQGTVAVDSTGYKTLAVTPFDVAKGERIWTLMWCASVSFTYRAGSHTNFHQNYLPHWVMNNTTVMNSVLVAYAITPMPLDLTAVSWSAFATRGPVMGVR